MGKANFSENSTLDANLRGVDPAFRASANRWIALYTADPGEAGTAITNEATFTGYARVQVTAATGFTAASAGTSTNTGLIQFPECTAGSETITHMAVVTTASGAGDIIYSGALTASRNVSAGIQLQFNISAISISED